MSRAGRTDNSNQQADFKKGDNHLLVIGINQYQDANIPKLRNARKDAEAVAQILQEYYGFDTQCCTTLYDQKADCESITDTLENLSKKVKEDDNLLIYFAGHGFYNKVTGIGYLLPADTKWGKPHSYISHSNLLDYMRAINSRHTFLVLDSCFSGALFRNVGDTHRAAANLERLPSRWGLAAGLIEEVSDGFYNDNSPFAKSLLAYLKTVPDTFLASDLIQHVKNAVPNNAIQQPQGGILHKVGDQQGEMVFRRRSSEALDWEKIADSQNINDFLAYLRKHGYQSRYAEDANARIKVLEDQHTWNKVNKQSISALLQFIRDNRESRYVSQAEKIISELESGFNFNSNLEKTITQIDELIPTKTAEEYYKEGDEKREKGDNQDAVVAYTKAIELNPQYAEAYNNRGITKHNLRDYFGAITDYNKAIELNPQYSIAYNNRGVANKNLQDYTGAIANYTKAIELNPKFADAYNNRGNAKNNLQDYTGAIADYTKAIELNPKYDNAYVNRGLAKYNLQDYTGAVADYTKAIEINLKYGDAYVNRGVAKYNLQDYTGAIADYTKAIEINPQYAIAYFNRGVAKNNLQDYTGAVADYTKAIELNPKYDNAYVNRGLAKYNLQDYTGAVADYTKAIELNPKYDNAYVNRGVAKYNLKDHSGAIADYTKAIEINPKDGLAYNNRGAAYKALGKLDLACTDWRRAIELGNASAPDNIKKFCQGK